MAMTGRPNVLIFHVDEQPWTALGCSGNNHARTSSIDRLATQGCRFSHCFTQSLDPALSCVSMLAGEYPSRLCAQTATLGDSPTLLSRILRGYGYRCAAFGAVHLAQETRDWREPHPEFGFEQVELSSAFGNDDAYSAHLKVCAPECLARIRDAMSPGANRPLPLAPDCTPNAFTTQRAMEMLQQQAKIGQPFFCVIGMRAFATPMVAPQRYLSLFDPMKLPLPQPAGDAPEELLRLQEQNYYASCAEIDALVGVVLQELERHHLAHNTLVVYTAGRGRAAEQPLVDPAVHVTDHMVRVPLIVRGPASLVHSDVLCNSLVERVDVAPTLLELLGIQVPRAMQGQSFRAVLAAESRQHRTSAITELPNRRTLRSQYFSYSIRADGTESMFDLSHASTQFTDLAADLRYRGTMFDHRQKLLVRMMDTMADCHPAAATAPRSQRQ